MASSTKKSGGLWRIQAEDVGTFASTLVGEKKAARGVGTHYGVTFLPKSRERIHKYWRGQETRRDSIVWGGGPIVNKGSPHKNIEGEKRIRGICNIIEEKERLFYLGTREGSNIRYSKSLKTG